MYLVSLFNDSKHNTTYTTKRNIGNNFFNLLNLSLIFIVFLINLIYNRKGKIILGVLKQKLKCFHHVPITWTLDKGPLIVLLFRTKTGVKSHLIIMHSNKLHWPREDPSMQCPLPVLLGSLHHPHPGCSKHCPQVLNPEQF